MANAVSTLALIAADCREFTDAAASDGFDPADALRIVRETAERAERRTAGIPRNAPLLVGAILSAESVCDDLLDLLEAHPDMVRRDRESAEAVRAKLRAALDAIPTDPDAAEAEFRDRILDRIDLISACIDPRIGA